MQMEMQLEILGQVRDKLDDRSQIIQNRVLDILTLKLADADAQLRGLVQNWSSDHHSNVPPVEFTMSKRKKSKYAMIKDHLDKIIEEIESWQRVSLNPLWFFILKFQSQQFDKDLDRAKGENRSQGHKMITQAIAVRNPLRKISSTKVFLPPKKLESAETAEIAFSSVTSVHIDNKWRLVDSVSNLSKEAVRNLVVKLESTNPSTFGLLTCLGAVHDQKKNEFSFIFRMPDNMSHPETLRTSIIVSNSSHSLSNRFRLATQLARAVCSSF